MSRVDGGGFAGSAHSDILMEDGVSMSDGICAGSAQREDVGVVMS